MERPRSPTRPLLELIGGPTFQRLRGVRQAGPSAIAFAFKNVTRFEHSLGVLPAAGPPGGRPPGAGRRARPRHLAHRVLARRRLPGDLRRAGPPREPQAGDAEPARHRRGAGSARLFPRRLLRRHPISAPGAARCPCSAPTGSTTSFATAGPAASSLPARWPGSSTI